MKIIFFLLTITVLSGCAVNKATSMKQGASYKIQHDGKWMVSFVVPEGNWLLNPSSVKTQKDGWINMRGEPPKSPIRYGIKFSIKALEKYPDSLSEAVCILKSQEFDSYLKRDLDGFTPQLQKEMNVINSGGKLIYVNELKCKNTWYQQKIAPLANNGQGITQLHSDIACPIIIDGSVYRFEFSITSSIPPKIYELQAEYNKNKRPEEQEMTIDTYKHLTTLGEQVLEMFSDIKFNGKVSQNYDDIVNK
jgi:hypothetical protein